MKRIVLPLFISTLIFISACNKAHNIATTDTDFKTLEQTVITDFANNVALSSYLKLSVAAANFNSTIQTLNDVTTDDNLQRSRDAWKNLRQVWEQCESFLFGPVEDNDYDPNMDTWPTDYVQLDSLLASNYPLEASNIQNLTLSLRGYHPIEYLIFGDHGNRKALELTTRQKLYMNSLSADIMNTCNALYLSWASAPESFAEQVVTAGNGSTRYSSKQEIYMALAGGLIDICEEVGNGKMKEPFDAKDPSIVESPYSGNSAIDFKNNIIGIQNVYMGLNGGKGLKDIVAAKNKSLDNSLQSKINAAINSFDNITVTFEEAIISQRLQVQQSMNALSDLKDALENNLVPFIQNNILD
ncbi:MAG: imelysin family protein [Ginsengibacter sp.]